MPSLNKVILIGNLVADPELKTTSNGAFRHVIQDRCTEAVCQRLSAAADGFYKYCLLETDGRIRDPLLYQRSSYSRMRFVAVSQLYRQGRQPANSV